MSVGLFPEGKVKASQALMPLSRKWLHVSVGLGLGYNGLVTNSFDTDVLHIKHRNILHFHKKQIDVLFHFS